MKNFNLLFAALIVEMFLCTGCSHRLVDFTIISSKNVSLIGIKKDAPRVLGKGINLKDAVDRAIEKGGNGYDALVDGVIRKRAFWGYKVEGTPIKTEETSVVEEKKYVTTIPTKTNETTVVEEKKYTPLPPNTEFKIGDNVTFKDPWDNLINGNIVELKNEKKTAVIEYDNKSGTKSKASCKFDKIVSINNK